MTSLMLAQVPMALPVSAPSTGGRAGAGDEVTLRRPGLVAGPAGTSHPHWMPAPALCGQVQPPHYDSRGVHSAKVRILSCFSKSCSNVC